MAQQEAVMIVLDVGQSVRASGLLSAAVRAVGLLVHQKILSASRDQVALVLFGTPHTHNALSEDGYQHVAVLREFVTPDVELLRLIEDIRPGGHDGDFIDALVVGMDLLVRQVGDRNYQKRVFLITDAGCDVNEDDLATILDKFNQMDAVLNVIGVDFAEEGQEDAPDRSAAVSETKRHNEKLIRNICQRVRGRVIPIQSALDLLSFTSQRSVLQRSNFRGWLELSRHVRIPVWSFTKTKEDSFPRLSKVSKLAQESHNPTSLAVQLEKTYHPVDDPDRQVELPELSKGYRYGKSLVPFDKIDQQNLKFTSAACLQLLGFCLRDKVPRHHYMGTVDAIVPLPADSTASEALSAIIHGMINTNSVAIVRFVKRANSAPQLGVLTPHVSKSDSYECLHFNKLPFHEDLRDYSFASLGADAPKKSMVPGQQQLDAMEDLINSMDLMVNPQGEQEEALKPKRTYNPALQHFYACVQSKALHPERPAPRLDPIVEHYVNPDKELLERAARALDSVKAAFPLVRTEQKEKETRRRFWSEAFASAAGGVHLDSYVNDDAKRQKLHDGLVQGGERLSIQSLISEVTDVGSVTPVEDFFAMISRKDVDLVDKAIEQMQRQTVKLVHDSVRDSHYSKAIDCLKALRRGCIEQGEVEAFNKFIADVKKFFRGTRRDDFWQRIRNEQISLIVASESEESEFSEKEAQAFLDTADIPGHLVSEIDGENEEEASPARPSNPDEPDADDLFDMIE